MEDKNKASMNESKRDETADHKEIFVEDVAGDAAANGQGLTGFENLTVWQTISTFKVASLLCFLVSISAAADGYQIALAGNIIANKGFVNEFGSHHLADGSVVLASNALSSFNAMGSLGQIIGMTTLPFMSNRLGRKFSMFYYWSILAMSIMTECLARTWGVWAFAKLLGGIGVGCMQITIPGYISEISPPKSRGTMLMLYGLWWITGQFFAPVALQIMSKNRPFDWLTPIYTQWGQIGLMFIIYLYLPESPVWLASRNKAEQAKKALQRIYKGANVNIDQQYELIALNLEHERAFAAQNKNERWYAIFKGVDGFRTLVACWTLVAQMFIGLGVFLGYGTYFFQQAGFADPFKITCITSGINIGCSVVVMYLADVTGRRWLACYGTTLCWVCCVLVGILGVVPKTKATDTLVVVFAVLWNIGLVANGATGWGYIGEIPSQRLRHFTSGFAAAISCVIGVILNLVVPKMINTQDWNWGLKTCWFYAGIGAPFTVAIWFLIPETTGRSAAELDELFERKIRPWRFKKTTTLTQRLVETEKATV